MSALQTAIIHLIGFLAALATVAVLGAQHIIDASTVQALLVGVLTAGGVYVGANVGSAPTTTSTVNVQPPTPPPG